MRLSYVGFCERLVVVIGVKHHSSHCFLLFAIVVRPGASRAPGRPAESGDGVGRPTHACAHPRPARDTNAHGQGDDGKVHCQSVLVLVRAEPFFVGDLVFSSAQMPFYAVLFYVPSSYSYSSSSFCLLSESPRYL